MLEGANGVGREVETSTTAGDVVIKVEGGCGDAVSGNDIGAIVCICCSCGGGDIVRLSIGDATGIEDCRVVGANPVLPMLVVVVGG